MKQFYILTLFSVLLFTGISSCKKEVVQVVDFSKITTTGNECQIVGEADSTDWTNDVLNLKNNTSLLIFNSLVFPPDSVAGSVRIEPVCPNPNNGFFIWDVTTSRRALLKVVCVNTDNDVLYYNAYGLTGGTTKIGFDFRNYSAFHKGNNYRMYYGFYTAFDSVYFSGHGDFTIR